MSRRPRPRVAILGGGPVTPHLTDHLRLPPPGWADEFHEHVARLVERQTAQLERDCFTALNLQDPGHIAALRVIYHHGYTDPPIPPAVASKWCARDTNGDGDCGNRWGCPSCRVQVDR